MAAGFYHVFSVTLGHFPDEKVGRTTLLDTESWAKINIEFALQTSLCRQKKINFNNVQVHCVDLNFNGT